MADRDGAEIPIGEHLTGFDGAADGRSRFSAVRPKIKWMSTFPVRAFAVLEP